MKSRKLARPRGAAAKTRGGKKRVHVAVKRAKTGLGRKTSRRAVMRRVRAAA